MNNITIIDSSTVHALCAVLFYKTQPQKRNTVFSYHNGMAIRFQNGNASNVLLTNFILTSTVYNIIPQ